ncbi:Zinc finger CCCH domain-containing protein 6 [Euphorbia peplus]|nr:Zinc finger CCCH domain-containing protein 6 [Euphorbia peplus]
MKRQRISNRVTWASGLNLCQVKLFLAEDSPSKVGSQTQDSLQKKAPSMAMHHLNVEEFNELPPGFEGQKYVNSAIVASSSIPRIQWKCPPKVVMRSEWHVAAGEESHEAEVQKFREMRTLEAVFPHPSTIPPSPSVSLSVEEQFYDDRVTPVIPLTPVEEEEYTPNNMTCELSPAVPQDPLSSGACNIPILEPASKKPKIGTSSALGETVDALLKTVDRSAIDTDLLVKIFSDPKMIENLMKGGLAPSVTGSMPRLVPLPCAISKTGLPAPVPVDQPISKPEPTRSFHMPTHGNLHGIDNEVHSPNQGQSVSNMNTVAKLLVESEPTRPPSSGMTMHFQPKQGSACISEPNLNQNPVMDMNYFKNLIREHGTEKKELPSPNMNYNGNYSNPVQNLQFGTNVEKKQVRSKFQKACMYFASPKGCRNGSNCPYQHDISPFQYYNRGPLDIPVSKRMKFSGEITTGRV